MDLDSTVRLGLLRLQQADGVWSFLKNSIYYKNIHRGDFKEQCIQNNTNANGATRTRTHTRQTHSKIITSRLAGVEPLGMEPGTEVETKCGRFSFCDVCQNTLPSSFSSSSSSLDITADSLHIGLSRLVDVLSDSCSHFNRSFTSWMREQKNTAKLCWKIKRNTHKKTKIPGLPMCLTQCLKHDINLSDQPERKRRPRQTHLYVCIYTEQGWKSCRAKNTRAEGRAQRSCWTQSRQTWFISSLDSTICFSGWKSGPRR